MTDEANRVWIELEIPTLKDEGERIALGEHRAARLTHMLARLCGPGEAIVCRYRDRDHKGRSERRYELIYGPMRLETLNEHGQWFNLDYFGRD